MDLSDILQLPEPEPKRRRGRPPSGPEQRERRELVVMLADTGFLPLAKVRLVAGIAESTLRKWRSDHRKTG